MMQDSVSNKVILKKAWKEIEKWYNELDNEDVQLTKDKNGYYYLYFQIRMAAHPDITRSHKIKIIIPASYNSISGSPGIQFRDVTQSVIVGLDQPFDFLKRCNTVFKNRAIRLTRALTIVVKKFNELVEAEAKIIADNELEHTVESDHDDRTEDNKPISESLDTDQIPDDGSGSGKKEEAAGSLPQSDATKYKAPAFGLNQYQRIAAFTTAKGPGGIVPVIDDQASSKPIIESVLESQESIVENADEVLEDRSSEDTQRIANGSDPGGICWTGRASANPGMSDPDRICWTGRASANPGISDNFFSEPTVDFLTSRSLFWGYYLKNYLSLGADSHRIRWTRRASANPGLSDLRRGLTKQVWVLRCMAAFMIVILVAMLLKG